MTSGNAAGWFMVSGHKTARDGGDAHEGSLCENLCSDSLLANRSGQCL